MSMDGLSGVTETVLAWADTPWFLVAVFALATLDGFFPPLPSESVVIAAAVLVATGSGPSLWWLVLAAAAGAFTGDVIAYHIGMLLPLEKIPILNSPRGRRSLAWAASALERRAAVYIMSARFVPIGRVAVNMTAGAVRFPRARFILTAGVASVIWASYATVLGLAAGTYIESHLLVAVAGGVVLGVGLGFVLDAALTALNRWFHARSERGRAPSTRVGDALLRASEPPEVLHRSEGGVPGPDHGSGPDGRGSAG
ncbi:MAG: DedA family protein [Actinomycetota bacterium]